MGQGMEIKPEVQEAIKNLPNRSMLLMDEVADFFQITKRTVYTWYDQDILKGTKIHGTLRIYRQSVVDAVCKGNGKKAGDETAVEVEVKIKQASIKKPIRPKGWVKNW